MKRIAVLTLAAAVALAAVSVGLNWKALPDLVSSKHSEQPISIAQKYGGSDPHGDDPHGDDPHDEQHDDKLPANNHRSDDKAPKDVYGGQVPNSQNPY